MTIQNSIDLVSAYLSNGDKENANKFENYTKLRGYVADEIIKEWVLQNIYSEDILLAHNQGRFHIHNLADGVVPYCKGHDVTKLLTRGLITQTVVSKPPKHLSSFFDQIVNLIATSQQSWAGAQAVANINTLAAPLIAKDGLNYELVRQSVQSFIYNLNYPSRAGSQTPFSNITLNFACPKNMRDEPVLNKGCTGTWGDYEDESFMIIKAFDEIFREGDGSGRPFSFPIVTVNLIPETPFDDDLWLDMMDTLKKFGTYSFFNYRSSGISPDTILSMCCHLQLDLSQIAPTGGRWAYAGETGSIGVVTLNMGRLGYESKDEEELFTNLDNLLSIARRALLMKSIFIEQHKERFMPLDVIYGTDLSRFFRTIGIVGLHEMTVNFTGNPLSEEVKLVEKVLNYIREWTRTTQLNTGVLWNQEMTPAESTASTFAIKDKKEYPDIYTMGSPDAWYYTSMLTPPSQELSVWERIKIEEPLLKLFSGGTVHRVYIGDNDPSTLAIAKIIERMSNTTIPYYDIAPTFSICNNGHYLRGAVSECTCGAKSVIYDRIVGYYRPRSQANAGKLKEIQDRRWTSI